MAFLGQVEQQRARLVQTCEGRNKSNRVVQQVLLSRRRAKWQGKEVFQGRITKAEHAAPAIQKEGDCKRPQQSSMEEIRDGLGGVQGHGHK